MKKLQKYINRKRLLVLLAAGILSAGVFTAGSAVYAAELPADTETGKSQTVSGTAEPQTEPVIDASLSKPKLLTVSNRENSIQITWKKLSKASGYYLYRKPSGADWEQIAVIPDKAIVSYTDTDVIPGKTYYYKLQAYYNSETNVSNFGNKGSVRHLIAPDISLAPTPAGTTLTWAKQTGAAGYYIYRRELGKTETEQTKTPQTEADQADWIKLYTIDSGTVRSWKDTTAENGKHYEYSLTTYNGTSESDYGTAKSYFRLTCPAIKSLTKPSATTIKLQWAANEAASGYQIQYSSSSLFTTRKTITVGSGSTTAKTISSLTQNKTYYVRIRAYVSTDGGKCYSAWNAYKNINNTKNASATAIKKGTSLFELRAQSKQTLYQYDTLQGSCTDGAYCYFLMYHRGVEKCKIVKVNLATKKVVKVSGILEVAHGNDMTYDSQRKLLVVVHSTKNPKRLSLVNPQTLCVEEIKDVTIPAKIAGATDAERNAITGFSAAAYNAQRKQYVMLLSKSSNLLILDQNMEVVSYVHTTTKNPYLNQGIDVTDDYILVSQSAKYASQSNILSVYTWEGQYVAKINVKKGYEIESVFHIGKQFYAGFYRSYYKIYYTNEKQTVVKNGKKTEKTVKVLHRKLMRDNYIYKVTNL